MAIFTRVKTLVSAFALLAVMAGAMAMLVAAIHDKLEDYDIQAHPA